MYKHFKVFLLGKLLLGYSFNFLMVAGNDDAVVPFKENAYVPCHCFGEPVALRGMLSGSELNRICRYFNISKFDLYNIAVRYNIRLEEGLDLRGLEKSVEAYKNRRLSEEEEGKLVVEADLAIEDLE